MALCGGQKGETVDLERWLRALAVAALLITPIGTSTTALGADRGSALAVPASHNNQPPDERTEQGDDEGGGEGQAEGQHEPQGADQRPADHDDDGDYDEGDDGGELGWLISEILAALHVDRLVG